MKKLSDSFYPMADVVPKGVRLIKDEAVTIEAATNTVTTKTGDTIIYDILLVAVGLQLKYDRVTLKNTFRKSMNLNCYNSKPSIDSWSRESVGCSWW